MSLEHRIHRHEHATDFDTSKRYDLIVLAKRPGFRLANAAARAILLNFSTEQWIKPVEERIDERWAEIYSNPGPSAHDLFTKSTFDRDLDVFNEVAFYFGQKAVDIDYEQAPFKVYFYIEFRGCLFTDLLGSFRKRLDEAFNLRHPRVLHRPAQEIPPRREVENEPVVG